MRIDDQSAMNSYRHLVSANSRLKASFERISSGLRINHACDDAANLAISEKMRSKISSYKIASANLQDGLSLLKTAEDSLGRVQTIVKRVRDLGILASNGDKTDVDRTHIQSEIDELLKEIDRIGKTSEYNTKNLFDGSLGLEATISADNSEIVDVKKLKVTGTPILRVDPAGIENSFSNVLGEVVGRGTGSIADEYTLKSGKKPVVPTSVTLKWTDEVLKTAVDVDNLDGTGSLVEAVSGNVIGIIDYASGDVNLDFSAGMTHTPDANTDILISYDPDVVSVSSEYFGRGYDPSGGDDFPKAGDPEILLAGIPVAEPPGDSIVLKWTDGAAKTASVRNNGDGTGFFIEDSTDADIVGDITFATGRVRLYFSGGDGHTPDIDTDITIDYTDGVIEYTDEKIGEGYDPDGISAFSRTVSKKPVIAGSIVLNWTDGDAKTAFDDGAGNLRESVSSNIVSTGINYATGLVDLEFVDGSAPFNFTPDDGKEITISYDYQFPPVVDENLATVNSGSSTFSYKTLNRSLSEEKVALRWLNGGSWNVARDNGSGSFVVQGTGDVIGTVEYDSGQIEIDFSKGAGYIPDKNTDILADYEFADSSIAFDRSSVEIQEDNFQIEVRGEATKAKAAISGLAGSKISNVTTFSEFVKGFVPDLEVLGEMIDTGIGNAEQTSFLYSASVVPLLKENPGSVQISWTDGGILKSAFDDGAGSITELFSGDLVGTVDYSTGMMNFDFTAAHAPDAGTVISVTYKPDDPKVTNDFIGKGTDPKGVSEFPIVDPPFKVSLGSIDSGDDYTHAAVSGNIDTGDDFFHLAGSIPVTAGTVSIRWSDGGVPSVATDNGAGDIIIGADIVGNIVYGTGTITLDFHAGAGYTPDSGTPITVDYSSGGIPVVGEFISNGIELATVHWTDGIGKTAVVSNNGDGTGNLIEQGGGVDVIGTITYATGDIFLNFNAGAGHTPDDGTPVSIDYTSGGVTENNEFIGNGSALANVRWTDGIVKSAEAVNNGDGTGSLVLQSGGSDVIGMIEYAAGNVSLYFEGGAGHIPDDGTAIEIQYESSGVQSGWEEIGTGDDQPPVSNFTDTLQRPVKPGTLQVTWTDGISHTTEVDAAGKIFYQGNQLGTINYETGDLFLEFKDPGVFNYTPDEYTDVRASYRIQGVPPVNSDFAVGYRPGDTFSTTLSESPVLPGEAELSWQHSGNARTATDRLSNSLLYDTQTDLVVGNINYTSGKVNLNFDGAFPTTPDAGTPIEMSYFSSKPSEEGTDGIYTFLVEVDGNQCAIDIAAYENGGDTMEEVIRKFNEVFKKEGLALQASLDTNPSESAECSPAIVFRSENYGSAHDINIKVVNRPSGGPYGENSFNRPDIVGFGLYNSNRTDGSGILSSSTKLVSLSQEEHPDRNLYSTLFGPEVIDSSIKIIDRAGKSLRLNMNEMVDYNEDREITIDEFIGKINRENELGNIGIKAVFNEIEGRIQLYSTDKASKGKISVIGSEDTDLNNQLAARLGIYGVYDSTEVIGERITSTRDVHLNVSGGTVEQSRNIFAKFGSRNTLFSDRLDNSGRASISGLEFSLQEKSLKKYERFEISVQNLGFRVNSGNFDDDVAGLAIRFGKISIESLGLKDIAVTTQDKAAALIDSGRLDRAIDEISSQRSRIGAFSNRLQSAIGSVENARENIFEAESRIRDADVAYESMATVREMLRAQAGVTMMSRATESMQLALVLLQSI